jgi:membrane-bound lytic murein transglycosylase A
MKRLSLAVCLLLLLAACMGPRPEPPRLYQTLNPVDWKNLPGWAQDSPGAALMTFKSSCRALGQKIEWQQVCRLAEAVENEDPAARLFFESFFQPYRVQNRDGSSEGLITGYYGPELAGRRTPDKEYRYPLYRQPDDLLIVDLDEVYPELDNYRLRGRLVGNRVVPYFERHKINQPKSPLAGQELFWLKDPVELFFLHVQGSGRIRLPDGERVMVNYANQNGHPYRSIGKLLLERGAMTRDQMSLQNIRNWVAQNPEAGRQLLAENPSYIFFRELPSSFQSPPGALGVPLTARRSLAVDPRVIPLGAPVYLATTFPGTNDPLRRLMMAQDTGGAIKGPVRADFFWGMGNEAGKIAGRMKQEGRLWVLLPKDFAQEMVVNIQRRNQDQRAGESVN